MITVRDTAYRDELAKMTPNLRRFAKALVQDHDLEPADDLVQATLVAALGTDQDRRGIRLLVWLMSTIVGLHRSRSRQISADKTVGLRSNGAQSGAGRNNHWEAPRSTRKHDPALLCGMPLECREVLLLIALEKLSYAQVAEALNISISTVVGRLARARECLGDARNVTPAAAKPGPSAEGSGPKRSAPYLRVVK